MQQTKPKKSSRTYLPQQPKIACGPTSKEIVSFVLQKHSDTNHKWVCTSSHEIIEKETGYKDLAHHLKRAHPLYAETVNAAKNSAVNGTLKKETLVSNEERKVQTWIKIVMGELEPFAFVWKHLFRKQIKIYSVRIETLCQYMVKLTERVKKRSRVFSLTCSHSYLTGGRVVHGT